jgi:cell division protein FtsQ
MPVTAPTDRRFLRAQIKPGRRESPWRGRMRLALRLLAAAVVVGVTLQGAYLVTHAEMLRVTRLPIRGLRHLDAGEVEKLLAGLRDSNILTVDLEAARTCLMKSRWVADATLRRSLPSTIEVTITERQPMAIARKGDQLVLIDEQGVGIAPYGPRFAALDLPLLDGLPVADTTPNPADAPRAELAARLIRALGAKPQLAVLVSQIDVSDPRDAVVIVSNDTARLRLGDTKFVERLERYLDIAPRMHEQVPAVDYVDLRFDDDVYVGPQAVAQATPMPTPPEPGAKDQRARATGVGATRQ